MKWLRRKNTDSAGQTQTPDKTEATVAAGGGPWDVSDAPDMGNRIDFGTIRIPTVTGMKIQLLPDPSRKNVIGVGVRVFDSGLDIQAHAAPKSSGIWDEVRGEIMDSIAKTEGNSVTEVDGPLGKELLARVTVKRPDDRTGVAAVKFIGFDGPRWFLRGVMTGKAVGDEATAQELYELFRHIVVVRGDEAKPAREVLFPVLPEQLRKQVSPGTQAPQPDLDPLNIGPTIAEIR